MNFYRFVTEIREELRIKVNNMLQNISKVDKIYILSTDRERLQGLMIELGDINSLILKKKFAKDAANVICRFKLTLDRLVANVSFKKESDAQRDYDRATELLDTYSSNVENYNLRFMKPSSSAEKRIRELNETIILLQEEVSDLKERLNRFDETNENNERYERHVTFDTNIYPVLINYDDINSL